MRDSEYTLYIVQHRYRPTDPWSTTASDLFLFEHLTFGQSTGETGNRYRAILAPAREGWRATGTNGFLNQGDGEALLQELRKLPGHSDGRRLPEFRLVLVTCSQRTEVVS
jgi:hypothetical protein